MKNETTIILLAVGVIALLYYAFSRGLIGAGIGPTGLAVNPGTGKLVGAVQVPQPTTNYSGYLAASTAPGVANALNGALSGLGNTLSSWLGRSSSVAPTNQGASPTSPALAAQPYGPVGPMPSNTYIGPATDPALAYDAVSGSAFDYYGLSTDNSFDSSYSLEGSIV
jgi:hypothetical protein